MASTRLQNPHSQSVPRCVEKCTRESPRSQHHSCHQHKLRHPKRFPIPTAPIGGDFTKLHLWGKAFKQLQKCTHVAPLVLFEPAAENLQVNTIYSINGAALQGGCPTAPHNRKELHQNICDINKYNNLHCTLHITCYPSFSQIRPESLKFLVI